MMLLRAAAAVILAWESWWFITGRALLFCKAAAADAPAAPAPPSSCIPFPEDLSNAGRVRRKTRHLAALNTSLPVIYLNADERKNEDLMIRHLLDGAPHILGEENHPDEDLAWPTVGRYSRVSVPPADGPEAERAARADDCHVTAVCDALRDKALAHVAAWDLAAAQIARSKSEEGEGFPAVLILEDDVMPLLPGIWEFTLDELAKRADEELPDWTVIRLFLPSVNRPYREQIINGWKRNFGKALLPVPNGAKFRGGAPAYLVSAKKLEDLRNSCPARSNRCFDDLAESFFAPLPENAVAARAVAMFTWNPVASDRSMRRVLDSEEGKLRYFDFVAVAQQNVENHVARSPSPGNVTEMLASWNDIWRPKLKIT